MALAEENPIITELFDAPCAAMDFVDVLHATVNAVQAESHGKTKAPLNGTKFIPCGTMRRRLLGKILSGRAEGEQAAAGGPRDDRLIGEQLGFPIGQRAREGDPCPDFMAAGACFGIDLFVRV